MDTWKIVTAIIILILFLAAVAGVILASALQYLKHKREQGVPHGWSVDEWRKVGVGDLEELYEIYGVKTIEELNAVKEKYGVKTTDELNEIMDKYGVETIEELEAIKAKERLESLNAEEKTTQKGIDNPSNGPTTIE